VTLTYEDSVEVFVVICFSVAVMGKSKSLAVLPVAIYKSLYRLHTRTAEKCDF